MRLNSQEINSTCRYRSAILCFGLMVCFGVIFVRLFFLQVIQAEEGADRARNQHHRSMMLEANRGIIADRNGKPLALNVEVPSVVADPTSISNPRLVAKKLAKALRIPISDILEQLKKKDSFVWIKRKLDPELAKAVQSLSLSGVNIMMEPRRSYPNDELLAHLMGFAGIDSQGLEGLEKQYDHYLSGEQRLVRFQLDALGRRISLMKSQEQSPTHGHRITLTIDEVIQYIAEQELETALKQSGTVRGTILVMDPTTGEVLAWALRPSFSPNQASDKYSDLWKMHKTEEVQELFRNHAATVPYEPGSTLKAFVAAAALEKGIVTPDEMVYGGDGEIPIAGTIVHDPAKSGWMTFSKALAQSSNVGIIKTAMELGEKNLFDYLRSFGFGEKTEIDLLGEADGILRPVSKWSSRSLASLAIGQEISVTPIQLVTAMSAVANGGWLLKPYVVSEIESPDGKKVFERLPQIRRRPISHGTAQTLTDMLVKVVEDGTGRRAFLPHYAVAGKTGTAQKIDSDTNAYSSSKFVGSFVGFVPADNPSLTILVVIDDLQSDQSGGAVAAPVFRKVAERVLHHMGVPPNKAKVIKTSSVRPTLNVRNFSVH